MKICPFVSHMLGEANYHTLTLDGASREAGSPAERAQDVVILGYEGAPEPSSAATATEPAAKVAATGAVPSHLYCLRESCRFYKSTGDCQFDLIFSMLDTQKTASKTESPEKTKDLALDLETIWKFQTRSVEEIVKTLGEAESNQIRGFESLKRDIESITKRLEHSGSNDVSETIAALSKSIDERQQSVDDLSTTVSEVVLNIHDSIENLKKESQNVTKQVAQIEASLPTEGMLKKLEQTLAVHRDLESQIGSLQQWQQKVGEAVGDFRNRQETWEKRIEALVDHQSKLMVHLEEDRKIRETETARTGKKEARKLNNLGVTSFHNGAYEMARDQFLQAVKIDPTLAEAFNNLGLAHTELGDEEKASEAFGKAVQLNPSLHAAYNNLGYIFFRRGEYSQAIEMYNEALGRSANNSSAYTNLGNAYFKLGRTEDARHAWTKALELDPGNEKARRNLDRIRADAK